MITKHIVFAMVIFTAACTQKQEQARPNTFTPKVVESKGYLVPKDSVSEPNVVPAGTPTIVLAGTPTVVPTNTNVHLAGEPTIVLAGTPRVITPGIDTFSLPKVVPAIDSPFVAGIPEVVIAKDAYVKDQNPQGFSSFSKLQGLKHDVISCMLQDKNGNLWFGTYGGVSKYDGKSFTHFTEKEGLCNNTVFAMMKDKSGNLWFGTEGGVSKYDGKSFTHFTEKEGLCNNTVFSMLEDKSGNLWFGTYGGGVSKYDGKSFMHFTEKEGFSNNFVYSMLEDKSGNLWFGTSGGVSKYDGKSFTHFTEKEGLCNNTVRSIFEDKSGNLWFGTFGGVSKYDGKSFTHFTEKEGLSNNIVFSMLEDKSGNLWFGTSGGVSKYDGESFTHFTEKEGLSNNTVRSILEDKSGNLWFGTDGGGVSKYDGKYFTHFTEKEGLSNNTVWSMLKDKSGNLWFGTSVGVSKYNGNSFTHFTEKEGLSNNTVRSILEDKSGNLWFGTYGGGISKYDGKSFAHFTEKEGLSNNTVRSILEDQSGNLWFGTFGGVSKYDGKSFTHFTEKEGLSNSTVLSILEDKSGNLWFGTYGGGVSKYDGKSFTHFTEKEGLSNNIVWSMLEDQSGNLWFGTDGGVSKYDGKSFTHFTEKEGLSNNIVFSMLEDKSGNLWFGSRFGLSKLSPKNKDKLVFFSNPDSHRNQPSKGAEGEIFFKNYSYEEGFFGIGVNGGKTICEDKNGTIWVAANDRLTAMQTENMQPDAIAPNIQLTSIALFNENIAWVHLEKKKDSTLTLGNGVSVGYFEFDGITKWYGLPENLSLAYNNNYLTFNFIGITMSQPKKVKYQYKLEGIDDNWSAISSRTEASYGNLPHGTYTFKVKAMNSEGVWSKPLDYTFTIRPPWWKTWWAYTIYGLLLIATVVLIVWWNGRKLRARAEQLKGEVKKATAEIVAEKQVVEHQKQLIEVKHKEITDSINYAERIQRSFLATQELLDENLKDYFVFFKPKDVVSGDFYWAASAGSATQRQFYLCCADSTGHGVPGAIMSIANIACLKEAVTKGFQTPDEILNETRKLVIEYLKNDGSPDGGRDGMDCALVAFNPERTQIQFALANNPLWIIRPKAPLAASPDSDPESPASGRELGRVSELIEVKQDKMPVGKHDRDQTPFTLHSAEIQPGDLIYIITDGYQDQFGGAKGKKLKTTNLQKLLLSMAHEPMARQKEILNVRFEEWKGDLEQVDDVCIIGVRV